MKKFLPAFTLIELLIVIAILVILALIGFAIFSGVLSKGRDAKRINDIIAMSDGMELNYQVGVGYTTVLQVSWFSDNTIPVNTGPGGSAYATTHLLSASTYTFCTLLENSLGNAINTTGPTTTSTGAYYCKRNRQ